MTKRRDCFASWCAGDYYTSKQTRTKLISRLLYIHIVKEAGTITISKYLWVSPYNSQLLYGSPYIPWPALNKVAPSKCVIWPTAALFWIPLWQLGGRRQEFGIDKDMPTISYFGRFDSQNFNQKSQCAVPAKFRSEAAVQLSNWPCMYYDPENYISNRVGCLFWFIQAIDCVCVTLRLLAGNTWVDKRDVRMMQSTVQTTRISGMTVFEMDSLFPADNAEDWCQTLTNSALETFFSIFPHPFKSKRLSTVHFTDGNKIPNGISGKKNVEEMVERKRVLRLH